ncbi:MAG: hypothetical protein M0P12_05135 [Paludibacteraceae bacterium]|nr:hypothetical protein [Paludibacteraceae bacterium]
MERLTKHRVLIVWLMMAIFALPFIVKIVHICTSEEVECCADGDHHDCNTCPVCQFTLSTFTESPVISYDFTVTPVYYEPFISYCEDIHKFAHEAYGLRAPPTI